MLNEVHWAYALNQWKPQFDDFVRRREHERAFKTISIAGFSGVELTTGSGRWEPFGNPQQIEANFGSVGALLDFTRSCDLESVSSYFYDPGQGFGEDLTPGYNPLLPQDSRGIVDKARWLARTLSKLGGAVLVVRPAPSAWSTGPLDANSIRALSECWNAVGRATKEYGVTTALHFDFLSALRINDGWGSLVDETDPAVVGVCLDTAEYTIAGIDPISFYRENFARVCHIQLKDTQFTDDLEEYLAPHADHEVRAAGGTRSIPRWFTEPGSVGGLVDFPALARDLSDRNYSGWIVVETDQSPHPATSALLSGWYVHNVLEPLLSSH